MLFESFDYFQCWETQLKIAVIDMYNAEY